MMGLGTIRSIAADATRKAAKENKVPLLVQQDDMGDVKEHLKYMPFLGDHVPPGYEEIESFFVDGSGWGTNGGSAITQDEFFKQVKVGSCYGVTETGQFQIHISEYKKLSIAEKLKKEYEEHGHFANTAG